MDRGDGGLDLEDPGSISPETCPDQGLSLLDEVAIPQGAVLIAEQDERPLVGGAGGAVGGTGVL